MKTLLSKSGLSSLLLSTLFMGIAWWLPGSVLSAVFGWLSSIMLVSGTRKTSGAYLPLYLAGVLFQPLGFYWLFHTISDFGGFGVLPTTLIFLLYAVLSAVQWLIFAFFWRNLPQKFDFLLIRTATAWTISEFISIRIFPWYFGHTQIAFIPFAQAADLAGALLITFIMLWLSEALLEIINGKKKSVPVYVPFFIFMLLLTYGEFRALKFKNPEGKKFNVALIQANISTVEKHNQKLFLDNTRRYISLSGKVSENTLIIWPESVILNPVNVNTPTVFEERQLALLPTGKTYLIGSLTYSGPGQYHNSAIGINPDGRILKPYHKIILMPFGEYTPLSGIFPWLETIHPTPNFIAGDDVQVLTLKVGTKNIKAAPLICYEDIVPKLSRRAVHYGAEVLVNLTNDAWFGNTVAPHQHHLIASFRAIENRRYLLRSTNSGLTAIVDPLGQTVAQLPVYSEGILKKEIVALKAKSVYTEYTGDWPWWMLFVISLFSIAGTLFLGKNKSRHD
ncbi:MAG: apolipoprotein N-acyltransferase [Candidatus Dadabacteria bacterium]|nr:MAG: apolipoprotein N-acyltransferase [Candidatus Dadabacteria bacterium]